MTPGNRTPTNSTPNAADSSTDPLSGTARQSAPSLRSASPYSTGGGGVTFEQRVGARYLALLLTAEGAQELGDGRTVASVSFQQKPQFAVDDLIIRAKRSNETKPSLVLVIGVRRAPKIEPSNEDTQKLIAEYVSVQLKAPEPGVERRWALVVSGYQQHAKQLAELATLAANQMDATHFFDLMSEGGANRALVGRLDALKKLVQHALGTLAISGIDDDLVRHRTWAFLADLSVLMLAIEPPDVSDRVATQNQLRAVSRGTDLEQAGSLLDRLETLAGEFAPSAATVDLSLLRRRVHAHLEHGRWRHEQGWLQLHLLQDQALAAVSNRIGRGGERTLHIDRTEEAAAIIATARDAPALVVHGASGVGKSVLVLRAGVDAASADADAVESICVNLRHLPQSPLAFVTALGAELNELLSEMGAPTRFLIIDGAEAAGEKHRETFIYLLGAARKSQVQVIAIAATDVRDQVTDLMKEHLLSAVADHSVTGLSDEQLDEIVVTYPEMARLAQRARSRGLLRRLVVVDLLVRSHTSGTPLSDADAMDQIWSGLIRTHERPERGQPHARQDVMLRLADRELRSGPQMQLVGELDAAAVEGLRRDGVLLDSTTNPWQPLPEFAHDELRRYAVARVLLADANPAAVLQATGAPRWTLSAAQLACQALLSLPDTPSGPLTGRYMRLQAAFDAVVASGHGARWGDVPGEALLSLGDPISVLTDAWRDLRSGDGGGLLRLLRLANQRHRDANQLIDPIVIEPIIRLLLAEATPWWSGEEIARCLRDWLRTLVLKNTPAGHPLRSLLQERLVAVCTAAEAELLQAQEEAARRRTARTPEEIKRANDLKARNPGLFGEVGWGPRDRKPRPAIPRELTDETMLEFLALLGPDLGDSGEKVLRRVALDAPWELAPAVEKLAAGLALAAHGRGLLADLTEAYYLDEEEDGSEFHDEGIRDHDWLGLGTPLAAHYRGPFMALFQSDLRRGVAVLNRLLNHATRARARVLGNLEMWGGPPPEDAIERLTVQLNITGAPRAYIGARDGQVWSWYRGTGVGPYPCMSALQALERVCDQLVVAGAPLDRVISLLLDGAESLAMPGLIVGLLTRHLERAGALLDPYLAEPVIWELEFSRSVSERTGLAATSRGVAGAERRTWSMREVAMQLVLRANPERVEQLRAIGRQLVAAAERAVKIEDGAGIDHDIDSGSVSYVTQVRNWASALDRDLYRVRTENDQMIVEVQSPDDVQEALAARSEDLRRSQEEIRLVVRYFHELRARPQTASPATPEELASDLSVARDLLEHPSTWSAGGASDGPAAACAAALEAHLVREVVGIPAELVAFSVTTLLVIAEGVPARSEGEFEDTFFEQGANRAAARALPLLLLPAASSLRASLNKDGVSGDERLVAACGRLACAGALEIRLHLVRSIDALLDTECSPNPCFHERALSLALETMRDCALGPSDRLGRRAVAVIDDPVEEALAKLDPQSVVVSRLDAAIRGMAAAAVRDICVQAAARKFVMALLDVQRRALLSHEVGDYRGSHALIAARTVLELAASGDDGPLHEHIAAYADSGRLLGPFLRALAAAAEENSSRAEAASRVWPQVMTQVLDLKNQGHRPFADGNYGQDALSALLPHPTYDAAYMYRELEGAPLSWTDALAWRPAIESWLPNAIGSSRAVDALVGLVRTLAPSDQVAVGLPWVEAVVMADVRAVARDSYLLAEWLIEIRPRAVDANALSEWQRLADALVVAGDTALSNYTE